MKVEDHLSSCLYELGITKAKFPETGKTPERVARMWREEFFASVDKEYTDFALSLNIRGYSQILAFRYIDFVSCCAHHLLPFSGLAHLLYIPKHNLIGASKAARCIEHYAKRPQLQETLTHDIIEQFDKCVQPIGTMVVIVGTHDCMACRGVKQRRSDMAASAVSGVFKSEQDMELKGYEVIKLGRPNH